RGAADVLSAPARKGTAARDAIRARRARPNDSDPAAAGRAGHRGDTARPRVAPVARRGAALAPPGGRAATRARPLTLARRPRPRGARENRERQGERAGAR